MTQETASRLVEKNLFAIYGYAYIAMQSFDEPYCRRIFEPTASAPISRTEAVRRDVMEQMAQTIASSPYVPTAARVRRVG